MRIGLICGVTLLWMTAAATSAPAENAIVKKIVDRAFKALDEDKDGKISKAEAEGSPLEEKFDVVDADKDGYVTRKELTAAVEKRYGGDKDEDKEKDGDKKKDGK